MKLRIDGKVSEVRAIWCDEGVVRMIDQRILPHRVEVLGFRDHHQVAEAIRDMAVRGAPAIGVAAAYGMMLAANNGEDLDAAAKELKATRPTAFDLFFAVDHMLARVREGDDPTEAAEEYANTIVERCRAIGEHGEHLIKDGARIMTHCNAGALATVDHGTALAPIREAWRNGKKVFVYVSETRPRLQGMKLTAFELLNEGIPHAIIPDGASGHFLREGVDIVIVGADRIAANGDFANKIGTFEKAVLAKELGVPFYTAAPLSTFDLSLKRGEDIPIEHRGEEEVTMMDGMRIAPQGCKALNPGFDVTPAKYVTGIITERGVLRPEDIARRLRGARL
ncbi:MAG TPA: S-methyl-5-thioribose-1-phosphate isomerase [Methanomassiliicoccales archaeon]|nr:S-methyl-5-thioribose-1-phosphate isomerase [Methanomassiliicoccales archaeon]HPD08704.1 S-methyl-5-thioribose-1-phosphate isomerase [Methanomassiliicoccales archaeon]